MELQPGEATMHHALTWHASGPNHTDHPRRAAVVALRRRGNHMVRRRPLRVQLLRRRSRAHRPAIPIGGPDFPLVRPHRETP